MAAFSSYWRYRWDFSWPRVMHMQLHMEAADFLCSQSGCTPGDGQAKDRGTAVLPSFMHFSFLFPVTDLCYI